MADMEILCFDKTGTLTENKLTPGDVWPWKERHRAESCLL